MPSAIVIGAGPVGAATAIGLVKQGFTVTMYDRIDFLARVVEATLSEQPIDTTFGETQGGDMSIFRNGLNALEHLGLKDELLATVPHLNIQHHMVFCRMNGTDPISHYIGGINLHLLRKDLHRAVIRASANAGAKLIMSKKLVKVEESPNGVTAFFDDGTTATADILIGCDGIHSTVRRLVFPEFPKPTFWTTGYIAVYEHDSLPEGTKPLELAHDMAVFSDQVDGRIVYYGKTGPKSGGLFILTGSQVAQEDDNPDWRPYTNLPKESQKLAEVVRQWGATEDIVDTVRHCQRITPLSIYELPDLPTYHKGRVILLGDAGHGVSPTIGQGVNSGFEDAAALADLFAAFSPEEYETVFKLYDEARIPRLKKVCGNARDIAKKMKAGTPFKAKVGRFFMSVFFPLLKWFGAEDEIGGYDYRADLNRVVAAHKAKSVARAVSA
ncbi:UNVERIFIED_CONTAM: hypothetical protein HDU68_001885 [Siphonaria sp. JEL0065]|nr:hypothetical protein HDU68_001885 [Siphonaria sp. JEL0065]